MDVLIEIYGTPKEIVVGEINEEQYEFWKEREHDLLYGSSSGGEFLSYQEYCLGKYNEYQVPEQYDFIIDDWSDLNDVYMATGFSQDENPDEIEVKLTFDSSHETLLYNEPKMETISIELDEPDIGSFHFVGNEIYEKQLCFSSIIDEKDILINDEQGDLAFDQKIITEISFSQDIIYDQKIITGVFFRNVILPNRTKINSSVIDQKFYLKP